MSNEAAIRDLVEHADRVVANLQFCLNDPGFWASDAARRQTLLRRLDRLMEEIMTEAPEHREALSQKLAYLHAEYLGRALTRNPHDRRISC